MSVSAGGTYVMTFSGPGNEVDWAIDELTTAGFVAFAIPPQGDELGDDALGWIRAEMACDADCPYAEFQREAQEQAIEIMAPLGFRTRSAEIVLAVPGQSRAVRLLTKGRVVMQRQPAEPDEAVLTGTISYAGATTRS